MSGSSVVVVAFLLEGVAWYAAFRGARNVVEFSSGRSGCESSSFSLIRRCRHFLPFVFSLSFLLGVTVLLPPQHLSLDGSVGCFVYKAGETLFRYLHIVHMP